MSNEENAFEGKTYIILHNKKIETRVRKEKYDKNESLDCYLEFNESDELVLHNSVKHLSTIIPKKAIRNFSTDGDIKSQYYRVELFISPKYQRDIADSVSVYDASNICLYSENKKQIETLKDFSELLHDNGIMTEIEYKSFENRKNCQLRLEEIEQQEEFKLIPIKCERCEKEWKMLDYPAAFLRKCPFCGSSIEGSSLVIPQSIPLVRSLNRNSKACIYIDDTVAEIEDNAFNGHKGRYVFVSSSVKSIGKFAFANMPNLEYAFIEEGVKVIADNTFQNCPQLKIVALPNSIEEIKETKPRAYDAKDEVFYGCKSIKKIKLPRCFKTARQVEQNAKVLHKDVKVCTVLSKENFETEETWVSDGVTSKSYGVYSGGSRVGTIRGNSSLPSGHYEYSSYSLAQNTFYDYVGTPEIVPFVWQGNERSLYISKSQGVGAHTWLSIENGQLIKVCPYARDSRLLYSHSFLTFDSASILKVEVKKPSLVSKGIINFNISPISLRDKIRTRQLDEGEEITVKYDKDDTNKVNRLCEILRENGIYVTML